MRTYGLIDVVDDQNFDEIMLMIDRAEEYRWHNLRTDPNDLPDDMEEVIILKHNAMGEDFLTFARFINADAKAYWNTQYNHCLSVSSVIAWKKIYPFEEDD